MDENSQLLREPDRALEILQRIEFAAHLSERLGQMKVFNGQGRINNYIEKLLTELDKL